MTRFPHTSSRYWEDFTPSEIERNIEQRLSDAHTFVETDQSVDDGDGSYAPLYRHAPDCPGCCALAAIECLADAFRRSTTRRPRGDE